jgi:hypothetical protein
MYCELSIPAFVQFRPTHRSGNAEDSLPALRRISRLFRVISEHTFVPSTRSGNMHQKEGRYGTSVEDE